MVISKFLSGETRLRKYEPVEEMATGSVRVLLDTYLEIPSEKQLNNATLTIEKDSFGLTTLISSQPIRYDRTGFGCSLQLSLASQEIELLSAIFGVFTLSNEEYDPSLVDVPRKRISLKDGDINSTNLNAKKVVIQPEPVPKYEDPNYLEWLRSVIIFPRGVVADPNQELIFSPKQQSSYKFTINCTPGEDGNRLVFGNEGVTI